jgi:hypothetical protein
MASRHPVFSSVISVASVAAFFLFVLQCKRPCSAARAKRAVRGGCGPVSGVWRLGLTGPVFFVRVQGSGLLGLIAGVLLFSTASSAFRSGFRLAGNFRPSCKRRLEVALVGNACFGQKAGLVFVAWCHWVIARNVADCCSRRLPLRGGGSWGTRQWFWSSPAPFIADRRRPNR